MELLDKVNCILDEMENTNDDSLEEVLIYFGDNYNRDKIDFDLYVNCIHDLSSAVFAHLNAKISVNILKNCREDSLISAIVTYDFFKKEIIELCGTFKHIEEIGIYITPDAVSFKLLDVGVFNQAIEKQVSMFIEAFEVKGVASAKLIGETGRNKLEIKLKNKKYKKNNSVSKKKEAVLC